MLGTALDAGDITIGKKNPPLVGDCNGKGEVRDQETLVACIMASKLPGPNPWELANVIKLRILRREDYFGLFGWALNAITCIPIGGGQREI